MSKTLLSLVLNNLRKNNNTYWKGMTNLNKSEAARDKIFKAYMRKILRDTAWTGLGVSGLMGLIEND